ncbi:hypothetical protein BGC07_00290 [Piscirickettsia litoralis]|uniref:Uncharacterized protein n=1 Tax=Piscirickettsia litoralis TaxID=1891921 RepID=A0ABX3A2U9_9GAMM|nr:hypothetical protein BGC07_00290 [Piscirickettsia litoralis]
MQYWAASESWGNPIRNSSEHIKAVKGLRNWSSFIKNKEHEKNDSLLFHKLGGNKNHLTQKLTLFYKFYIVNASNRGVPIRE